MHDLYSSLLKISDVLSRSSDNEVCINVKLSINLSLYVAVLPLLNSFLISTEKVIYFSLLSPIKLISPLNSLANWFIYKMSIISSIMNYYWIFLRYFIF